MTPSSSRNRLHYTLAIVWLATTVSLASWWLAVSLGSLPERMHRMFMWEGATFITLLLAGGIAIVAAIRREHLRRQAQETFFLSFTHDLKTSLASVQLQAEGLREDWPRDAPRAPLDRLLHDALRLQIQLENSLLVAQPDGRLLPERIDGRAAIARLAEDWPELAVVVTGDATLLADARGFEVVVRNLLQNAVVHGGATHVSITITPAGESVRLTIADNGRGVPPDGFDSLGHPFTRAGDTGGSGMGLFVCRQLIARMRGAITFRRPGPGETGLAVDLELPRAL